MDKSNKSRPGDFKTASSTIFMMKPQVSTEARHQSKEQSPKKAPHKTKFKTESKTK